MSFLVRSLKAKQVVYLKLIKQKGWLYKLGLAGLAALPCLLNETCFVSSFLVLRLALCCVVLCCLVVVLRRLVSCPMSSVLILACQMFVLRPVLFDIRVLFFVWLWLCVSGLFLFLFVFSTQCFYKFLYSICLVFCFIATACLYFFP